nr:ABC transporter substrate-binding protein [Actinomyces ruminis]
MGSHREPDLEALAAATPDLVIVGQRFSDQYDSIASLTPDATLLDLEPREGESFDAELERQVTALGQVFGKEAEAEQLIADFEDALERAQNAYDGSSTVMAVIVSGGEIGYSGPTTGRTWGPLFDLLELQPALEVEGSTDDHQATTSPWSRSPSPTRTGSSSWTATPPSPRTTRATRPPRM